MTRTFPSRSDYETVVRRLDLFAASSAIKAGKVLMRKDGLFPQAYSGGRAVVFPVLIESRKYAVKCWIQSLGALEERYQAVSKLIEKSKPPYLIESVYRKEELLFNGVRYPVLQMQWSESITLKEWITRHINDSSRLSDLAQRFIEVVADMHSINMSHGDLQHENILVSNNSAITLVDYDSIYLKGLDHLNDEVKGLPGFQHHSRSFQDKVNPKSDYLSEYVIYITLMALSKKPDLWRHAKDDNRLIFSQDDINNPGSSAIFKSLRTIDGLSELIDAFELQCLCLDLNDIVSIDSVVLLPRPPSPSRLDNIGARGQEKTTTERASGSARDLRAATTWASSRESNSRWIFDGRSEETRVHNSSSNKDIASSGAEVKKHIDNKNSCGTEEIATGLDQKDTSTDGYDSRIMNAASNSGVNQYPLLATPNHSLEGSLKSLNIARMQLASISFEDHWIRLICTLSSGIKNDVLVFKDSLIGLRSIGNKLELVTSGSYGATDVLIILAPDASGTDSIGKIVDHLRASGIDTSALSGVSLDSQIPNSTVKDSTKPAHKSQGGCDAKNQDGRSEYKTAAIRPFAYSTVDDISYCTGMQHQVIQDAAKKVKAHPPFTLIEADRIAGILLGDYSIKRAYEKRYLIANSDTGRFSSQGNATSVDSANTRMQGAGASWPSEWQTLHSSTRMTQGQTFSYSTVDDIMSCTGKERAQVLSAAKKIKAQPPFTLIEADRIAGILLGDPSIRRAFMKSASSQHSDVLISNRPLSRNRPEPTYAKADPVYMNNRADKMQDLDARDLPRKSSTLNPAADLNEDISKGDCFVATAIYGTDSHPDLTVLRDYRDRVLLSTCLGRRMVSLYYRIGPVVARLVIKAKLTSQLRPVMSIIANHLSSSK